MPLPSKPSARLLAILALAVAVFGLVGPGGATRAESRVPFRQSPALQPTADGAVAELGTMRWRFQTDGPVRARPALDGDQLFVGSSDGNLYGLDADSGAQAWRYEAAGPVTAAPAIGPDAVFVVDRAGAIAAVDRRTGSRRWRVETGAELALPWGLEGWDYISASPVLAGRRLITATGDGVLRALDPADGRELWRYATGGRLRATPTVVGDRVFIGDGDGLVHAVELASGRGIWTFETEGHALTAADVGFDRRQIYSRVAVADGVAYVGSRDRSVYALDAASGRLLWKTDDGTSGWVIARPTLAGGRLYETRSSSTRVRALDPGDGSEIWNVVTGGAVFGEAEVVGDIAYVGNASGMILALDAATGQERWRYGIGAAIWSAPLVRDGMLFVGGDDGGVYAFGDRQGPTPELRVFWDAKLAETASLGSAPHHAAIPQYFRSRGYAEVDGERLAYVLSERIADRRPSVVVFAIDEVPAGVLVGGEGSLLRRYVAAGGRAVWLGMPPGIFERNAEGQATAFSRQASAEALGVDMSIYNTDSYGVFPTAAGRARGLVGWWTGFAGVVPDERMVVLARNELGQATAWERDYGGGAGSGFVTLYPTADTGRLDEIRAVAEYGVFRSPTAADGARR